MGQFDRRRKVGVIGQRTSRLGNIRFDSRQIRFELLAILLDLLVEFLPILSQLGDRCQPMRRAPGFYLCSTPCGLDQADRNAGLLMDLAAEIKAHSRELTGRLWRADGPPASCLCRRMRRHLGRHQKLSQEWDICILDVIRPVAIAQRPFHVGLPAAHPDITNHDILHLDLVVSGYRHDSGVG